jgi:uncharacterized protein YdeI (YjbR/CyaY-like superfamily)
LSFTTFTSREEFRNWLKAHHGSAKELLVRCYKTHVREKGLTYQEALEEALCFGWIDGVRRAVDEESFSNRFTPRKPKSKWSQVNIRKVEELEAAGRMEEPGRAAFAAREASHGTRYSLEEKPTKLDRRSEKAFRANKKAWRFFESQPPWYRRTSTFWVMEAKRPETRERRLAELIACSARGEPIKLLDRRPKSKSPA